MAFWSDFLKAMKSTVFKNVLKNGDYSVKKLTNKRSISTDLSSESGGSFDGSSDVNIGVKNTLPIKHGGTGASTAKEAIKALGAVSKSGDTIDGGLVVKKTMKVSHEGWAGYEIQSTDGYSVGTLLLNDGVSTKADGTKVDDKTTGQLIFSSRRRPADNGTEYCQERFRFPNSSSVKVGDEQTVNKDQPSGTGQVWYDVLTSKRPVTVAQGGTGATNAATARQNLGVPATADLTDGIIKVGKAATAESLLTKQWVNTNNTIKKGLVAFNIIISARFFSCTMYVERDGVTSPIFNHPTLGNFVLACVKQQNGENYTANIYSANGDAFPGDKRIIYKQLSID